MLLLLFQTQVHCRRRAASLQVQGTPYRLCVSVPQQSVLKLCLLYTSSNKAKIELYKSGIDPTEEVGDEIIKNTTVQFTCEETKLRDAKFHIVAVPTPVNTDHTPDLSPVIGASETVGRNLTKGSIVVYESTVYPGVTEDVCVPILERESGMKCGIDVYKRQL